VFTNILLAFDGSPHSIRATQKAAEIARSHPGTMWVVVAYERIPIFLGESELEMVISAQVQEAEEQMQKALEIIGDVPGEIKREILEGSAAEAVLKVAKNRDCDLIVMGSRGLGRLAGLLLGSQSQKVISHATCPVLIVH